MHSTLVRAQNVFGFFTTVAFIVGALVAVTGYFSLPSDGNSLDVSVDLKNVQVARGRPHYYSSKREEYAQIRFDLDADLSPLFTWNTKQVFLYIMASYPPSVSSASRDSKKKGSSPSPNPGPSNAIIYDKIITSRDEAHLELRNQRSKYQITDISGRIANRHNATLEVAWNVQPWVGALTWGTSSEGRSKAFAFPALKSTGAGGGGAATATKKKNVAGEQTMGSAAPAA
ncbi:signal peptidase 22 kDa subunit [Xylona heveae TC161]|uniref:Signal peptidase subunit 3 n=1 Tax=Xylona heveae (strain CBS 132557 / TC161) TaxID=1328760 RepID=A0A165AEI2_XYLHT|nr:signal peptidase 22 kDa subunit [Xylona heveae TC161]KZF20346.1 signal peptidase 22 kDa subunit [Xylona heveae TC161]